MTDRYQLTSLAAGVDARIDLTSDEFTSIKQARDRLAFLEDIEDKFEIFVDNFVALEQGLLDSALRLSLFGGGDWASKMDARQQFNRHLVNFLATARLYIDQVSHIVSDLGDPHLPGCFREQLRNQYDGRFGYRVMEALRNYSQHRSLPIVGVRESHRAVEESAGRRMRVSTEALLDTKELSSDPKFKSTVLAELRASFGDPDVNIAPFVREYVEGIYVVHEWLRNETTAQLDQWKGLVTDAIARAVEFGFEPWTALGIVVADEETGAWSEAIHINPRLYERLEALRRKQYLLNNLATIYVASIP